MVSKKNNTRGKDDRKHETKDGRHIWSGRPEGTNRWAGPGGLYCAKLAGAGGEGGLSPEILTMGGLSQNDVGTAQGRVVSHHRMLGSAITVSRRGEGIKIERTFVGMEKKGRNIYAQGALPNGGEGRKGNNSQGRIQVKKMHHSEGEHQ